MRNGRVWFTALLGAATLAGLGGCPTDTDYIPGHTGDQSQLGSTASVNVVTPPADISITGGAPIEVNWIAIATTNFASLDVIFDVDQNPDNDNEIIAESLTLTNTSVLLDTSELQGDTYYVGVVLRERNEIAAYDYAAGRLIVNQLTDFTFKRLVCNTPGIVSPPDQFVFDRSFRVAPEFTVAWELSDPDSTVTVRIYLDPDSSPSGNELLLRESNDQHGDSFSFNLPTSLLEAGTYRLLAAITDQNDTAYFYAPGSIRLLSRLAGYFDLRELTKADSTVSGAIFEGFNPHDNAGSFINQARDLDRDGFGDFFILSQFAKPQYDVNLERTGVGEAYLVYGRANRYSGVINLNSTGTLFRGDIFAGVPQASDPIRPSRGITSCVALSDWDGDGLRELAFGLPFTDSLAVGQLGSGTTVSGLAPLDRSGYFRSGVVVIASSSALRPELGYPGRNVLNLAEFGTLGHVPLQAIIPFPCPEGFVGPKAGAATGGYTLFHRHLVGVAGSPNEGSIRLGCRLSSNEPFDFFGESIAAGDFDSIIMSAPNRDPRVATVFNAGLGRSIPGAGVVSIYYCNVVNGFFPWTTVQSANGNDLWAGFATEGHTDLLPHGGPYMYIVDDFQAYSTAVGLLSGSPGYWVDPDDAAQPCEVRTDADAPHADRTTRIWGGFEGAAIGNVSTVQDFNGDGLQDLLVGSPLSNEGAGSCFVVLGRLRNLVMSGELAIEELGLPMNGNNDTRIFDGVRVIGGSGDRLGLAQADAGDFNSDGLSDILIGSPYLNNRRGGAAIFFGSLSVINLTQEEIPFDELVDRGLGIIFRGENDGDLAGARVANVGDIDGDGNTDIVIAAPDRSVKLDTDLDGTVEIDRTHCGVVYLIYGSPHLKGTLDLADVGTARLPGAVFIGRHSDDHLGAGLGDQGDRSIGIATAGDVDGDGRNELLLSSVRASPRDRVRAGEVYLIYGEGD